MPLQNGSRMGHWRLHVAAEAAPLAMETVEVDLGDRTYPIYIGRGLLDQGELLRRHVPGKRALIVTNTTVGPIYLDRCDLPSSTAEHSSARTRCLRSALAKATSCNWQSTSISCFACVPLTQTNLMQELTSSTTANHYCTLSICLVLAVQVSSSARGWL